jgi:hypothetical protein
MIKRVEGYPPGIWFFVVIGLASMLFSACGCPTGFYDDNFGRFYTLLTTPTDDSLQTFTTAGTVDTRDWGCGIWEIRPEPPLDPAIPTVQRYNGWPLTPTPTRRINAATPSASKPPSQVIVDSS